MSMAIAHGPDQDRIDREASEWLVRQDERNLEPVEQRAFDDWRAADPRHEATYAAMARTWGELPGLQSLAELVPLVAEPPARVPSFRRYWMAAGALALAAALALLWAPSLLAPPSAARQSYATRLAEIRELVLSDGSRVTLGPRSALTEMFTAGERRVVLADGEAFFDVVHDSSRPFVIEANRSLVRVTGTKFNVNSGGGSLRVAVLEGSVEVIGPAAGDQPPPAPRRLAAGQRLEIVASAAEGTSSQPIAVEATPSQRAGAWREGRLVYENARLGDLVADLNRYYAPGVTLADPRIADLRVTASFKASEIPAFMNALGDVVPVRTRESPTGGFRLERAGS